jgi:hypothetical protein
MPEPSERRLRSKELFDRYCGEIRAYTRRRVSSAAAEDAVARPPALQLSAGSKTRVNAAACSLAGRACKYLPVVDRAL